MKFSLVLATIGRTIELERFLVSLKTQSHKNYELIVVDQNPDERLVPILARYSGEMSINHLRSERGLSKARNVGLKFFTGDIIAFPDDDCEYPPRLLENVASFFELNPFWDGLAGKPIDHTGNIASGRFGERAQKITRWNVWRSSISFTIFVRANLIQKVGSFDESLGVGASTFWGSGEETDYLLNCVKAGFNLYYEPDVEVIHPDPLRTYDLRAFKRGYYYGMGAGRVLKKHSYPLWFITIFLLRPCGGSIISLMKGNVAKAHYHWNVFLGRIKACSTT